MRYGQNCSYTTCRCAISVTEKSPLGEVVIAAHSGFSNWVFAVARELARDVPGRPLFEIDRNDVVQFWAQPRPIFLTTYPSKEIVSAIASGDLSVLYLIEDPLDVTEFLCHALGLPVLEAVRSQTASAVANLVVGRSGQVQYLDRNASLNARQLIERIASFLSIACDNDKLDRLVRETCGGAPGDASIEQVLEARSDHYLPPLRGTDVVPQAIGDPLLFVSAEVLDPMYALAKGNAIRPIVWPTQVFKFADAPNVPAPLKTEISGPVRNLFYGPYFHLPPARYRVEAVLSFSDGIQDVPFALEIHGARWLARAQIAYRKAGEYRGYMYFQHDDPLATVEIRLRNERDVQRGHLSLIELAFFVEEPGESSWP